MSADATKDTKGTKDTETRVRRGWGPKVNGRRRVDGLAHGRSFVSFVTSVSLFLLRNGSYLSRIEGFEEAARRFDVELRIPRLDAQEEPVAAREREPRHVEHRVIRHRQPVQREHAEHGRQRGDENRALEGDRDERRPAVQRLAADVQRIRQRRRPVLQSVPANAAAQPADQHGERQPFIRPPWRRGESFASRRSRSSAGSGETRRAATGTARSCRQTSTSPRTWASTGPTTKADSHDAGW